MEKVFLCVYELNETFKNIKSSIEAVSVGKQSKYAVPHTSLVLYGLEIHYGPEGIKIMREGQDGTPKTKILMGETPTSKRDILTYLDYLGKDLFFAKKYNVVTHNCNTFTNFMCLQMFDKEIPIEILTAPSNSFETVVLLYKLFTNKLKHKRK